MKTLIKNFLKGCLVLVPTVVTLYVIYFVIRFLDKWISGPVPGLALVLGFFTIAAIGAMASHVIGQRVFGWLERLITSVPLVKLLYTALRDLLSAFVGERRSFDHPVVVALGEGAESAKLLGFVTCDDMSHLGLEGHVAVYFPQSVNFAGNLAVVPRARVTPLEVDQAAFMTFIVSGGVVRGGRAAA